MGRRWGLGHIKLCGCGVRGRWGAWLPDTSFASSNVNALDLSEGTPANQGPSRPGLSAVEMFPEERSSASTEGVGVVNARASEFGSPSGMHPMGEGDKGWRSVGDRAREGGVTDVVVRGGTATEGVGTSSWGLRGTSLAGSVLPAALPLSMDRNFLISGALRALASTLF